MISGDANLDAVFSLRQVDHDVCSNYGNWLYTAGIGNDPRENRKFNMIKQGLDYDSNVSHSVNRYFSIKACSIMQ